MLYSYDKERLNFYKLSTKRITMFLFLIASLISFTSVIIGKYIGKTQSYVEYTEMERMVLIKESDGFSKEKFVSMLSDLNVKYPHIVLAQSMIETGKWKSNIFLENQNLFGMKEAKSRITTAEGTQHNHAFYEHWRESVYDYAFYQSRYLHNIRSEGEYFQYLAANYAEDPNYLKAVKSLIEKENLKSLFN
jgi:uncharacterized FlgJ-related protein